MRARGFAISPISFPSPDARGWRAERRRVRISPDGPEGSVRAGYVVVVRHCSKTLYLSALFRFPVSDRPQYCSGTPRKNLVRQHRPTADADSFSDHWCARRTFGGRSWREGQCQPHSGARNTVLGREVLVALYVEVALISFPCWKNESDLRTNAERASFEIAELGTRTTVSRDLLVKIADDANVDGLAYELRCPPIEVEVDAVAVLRVRIDKAIGQAGHG